jgi:MT0933-like antitoxin protein
MGPGPQRAEPQAAAPGPMIWILLAGPRHIFGIGFDSGAGAHKVQARQRGAGGLHVGFMDSVKGWMQGKKPEVKSGIDKGADAVTDKVGTQHADKVDKAADTAKDAVDKLPD